MYRTDLHMHSTRSDGSMCVEELFERAKEAGLAVISVTDHEIAPDLERMERCGRAYGVAWIAGLEVAGVDPDTGLRAHILGYGMKQYEELLAMTTPALVRRNQNTRTQIGLLQKMGYSITIEQVQAETESPYLYRQHTDSVLLKTGQIASIYPDWVNRMYKKDGPLQMSNTYPSPAKLVRAIRRGGGYAVLAHPGQQHNIELVPALVEAGLNGLELEHPSNSVEDKKTILDTANQYKLFLTGGSDCHGTFTGNPTKVGEYGQDWEELPEWMLGILRK